jgi:hypothetical protein
MSKVIDAENVHAVATADKINVGNNGHHHDPPPHTKDDSPRVPATHAPSTDFHAVFHSILEHTKSLSKSRLTLHHGVTKVQSLFRSKQAQRHVAVIREKKENEKLQRMRLQAIWQLLVTGFEVRDARA